MAILKSIVSRTASPLLARVLEALLYALSLAWLGGVGAGAAALATHAPLPGLGLWGVGLAALLLAALGVTVLTMWAELYGQQVRDLRAAKIFAALQRGETPPPYTLYLRPFLSTDAFREVGAGVSVAGAPLLGFAGAEVELEAQVESAVRPLGPLIALGQPLEHIGAGRVLTDDASWRQAIDVLMKHARLIVMLPSSRQGTLEEIDMVLSSDLVERTVFLDPPNLARAKRFDHAAEWDRVRQAFEARGFSIPADSRAGLLMFFGRERAPRFKERLDIDADDRIARLFRRVVKFRKAFGANAAEAA